MERGGGLEGSGASAHGLLAGLGSCTRYGERPQTMARRSGRGGGHAEVGSQRQGGSDGSGYAVASTRTTAQRPSNQRVTGDCPGTSHSDDGDSADGGLFDEDRERQQSCTPAAVGAEELS